MTKLEIIEETANFYNLKNRASSVNSIGRQSCVYEDAVGNKCAVGRCLIDTSYLVNITGISVSGLVTRFSAKSLDELLKEEYRGHERLFWSELQSFHDNAENFTNEGLSNQGVTRLSYLKDQFKEINESDSN